MTSYNLSGFQIPRHIVRRGRQMLALGAGALSLSSFAITGVVLAKTPGKTYCHKNTCHRVKTLNETKALVGRDLKIKASYYEACTKDRFNSCGLTSSGEVYKPHKADNAASSVLPDGTVALVWSETSGEAIVLRINNAGPYWGNRKLDLSAAAARKLGMKGVEEVTLRVVKAPTEDEARFEKNRSYDPVIGPLGKFASLELAQKAMSMIRADGLKNTPSLASLEDLIPASGPEVKVASLDETFYLSPEAYEKGEGLQSRGKQTEEEVINPESQSLLNFSPFSRMKDFLSSLNSQMLSSVSEENLIESSPSKSMFGSSKDPQSVEGTDGSLNLENSENTPQANKAASSTLSSNVSTDFKDRASGYRANKALFNKSVDVKSKRPAQTNAGRSKRPGIKISSMVLKAGDKIASQKLRKKST